MRALVKIDKKDSFTLEKVCAEASIDIDFYTIEENELMVLASIECLDPGMLFVLGRMLQSAIEIEGLSKIKPISLC